MLPKHYFLSILSFILFTSICLGQTIDKDQKYIQQRDSLFRLAAPYFSQSDVSHLEWKKPISYLNEAKQLAIEANDQEYYLYALDYLIYLYKQAELYDLMKVSLDEAESQHNDFKIDDKKFSFYINKDFMWAEYYYVMGDYNSAIVMYQEYIEKYNQEYEGDIIIYQVYNNIALAFEKNSDYEKAIEYYQIALNLIPKSASAISRAITIQNIAKAYFSWGKFLLAIDYYNEALEILGDEEANDLKCSIYRNKSIYFFSQNKPDSALIFINKALDLASYKTQSIVNLIQRAKIHLQQKNYSSALADLNTALAFTKEQYPKNKHPKIGEIYLLKGQIATEQNNYSVALQAFQQALIALNNDFADDTLTTLPSLEQVNSSPTLLKVLRQQARVWQQMGALENALANYQKAADLLDYMRLQQLESTSAKYFLLEQAKTIYEEAIAIAMALDQKETAFAFSQKGHGLLLTQHLMDRSARQFAGIPDSLLAKERVLQYKISNKEQAFREQEQKNRQDTVLFQLKAEYRNFVKQLEQDYPVYYQHKYQIPTADVATIQAKLGWRKALLEYFVGQDSIYIFLITSGDLQVFAQPKADDFLAQIEAIQRIIIKFSSSEQKYQDYTQAAHQLYQQLLEPALATLPFYINELIIVADEQLHYIPFQILLRTPAKASMRYDLLNYLVKDYVISYQYSSALFSNALHEPTPKKRETLVGFAPTFGGASTGPRNKRLNDLVHTKKEVQSIQLIAGGDTYLGSTATAAVFKQNVGNYSIAHIASHANFDDTLDKSRIYFADTGIRPAEIYNLPMNLDLVVLSACETAKGKLQKGEGLIGWTQAFLYAGCPSVIASLWSVNDEVTADLMVDLYKGLFAGKPKDMALAMAQRNYLNQQLASAEAHPYYWAAFIPVGNTEPVIEQVEHWQWLVGLLFVVGLAFWWWKRRR